MLEDLASQNGTFVSGRPVRVKKLEQGDVIRIGTVATLRFCFMDDHQCDLIGGLYEASVRDALTGAHNRRYFAERLAAEVAFARRHREPLSLLLLDVDYFRRINEHYGQPVGDRVLSEVTASCQRQLRTEDVFARYGGDEFAVLLRGIRSKGALRAADRLRSVIRSDVSLESPRLSITVSIGCASIDSVSDLSGASLVRLADQRLYEARQAGRDQVVGEGVFSRE